MEHYCSNSTRLRPCFLLLCYATLISIAAVPTVVMSQPLPTQGPIGVCNGRVASNLPTEQEVVNFYKVNGIGKMRIYDPNQATLTALGGSNIELMLGVPNSDLHSLQTDATLWVQTNVRAYYPATKIKYIAVGNEVDPDNIHTSRYVPLVLPAMQSIYRALTLLGLEGQIKVSTSTYSALLQDSYPPSNSTYKHKLFMHPIIDFLAQTKSPLLANIYPYFAHIANPAHVSLPYSLFTSPGVVVRDGVHGYQNLFDAMLDGMHAATEKVPGAANVTVVVSESGWPSAGGAAATMENAGTYYRNLIGHVKKGTPKRPGKEIETYLFAMFDENMKPGALTEQHFGLFYPSKQIKYQVSFNNV